MLDVKGRARLMARERRLAKPLLLVDRSSERRGPAMRVEPGKEEEFRYLRGWLAASEWLDRLIAATEPEAAAGRRLLEWSGGAARARPRQS